MKKIILVMSVLSALQAKAGTGDVGSAEGLRPSEARCIGTIFANLNSSDKGRVAIELKDNQVFVQVQTSTSLKNYKQVYSVTGGVDGYFDRNKRLHEAQIYSDYALSLHFGVNPYNKDTIASLRMELANDTYYGELVCEHLK